jgi:hypothetical protein
LPDPAATARAVDGLIDQLGRARRGARGGRAAPGLPSANPSSFYELAAIVAGQPRRDPQPESLKLPVALQLDRGPALLRFASRSRRHERLFRSCLHSSSDNPFSVRDTRCGSFEVILGRRELAVNVP